MVAENGPQLRWRRAYRRMPVVRSQSRVVQLELVMFYKSILDH